MEEFVAKVRDSINQGKRDFEANERSLGIREFIKLAMSSVPDIEIKSITNDGDIAFAVDMKGMGVTQCSFVKFRTIIFSDYMANFLGEFFVRENINLFAKILTDIDSSEYNSIVNNYEHKRFGMEISSQKITFSFHVSLLQSILTEDLKKI